MEKNLEFAKNEIPLGKHAEKFVLEELQNELNEDYLNEFTKYIFVLKGQKGVALDDYTERYIDPKYIQNEKAKENAEKLNGLIVEINEHLRKMDSFEYMSKEWKNSLDPFLEKIYHAHSIFGENRADNFASQFEDMKKIIFQKSNITT